MADTVGNRNGPRRTFLYVRDDSETFNMTLDESVGLAVGNAPSTDGDAAVLPASQKRPTEPRYMLFALQSDPSVRKKAIICDYTNTLFLSNGPDEVTINGVVWIATARIGEKRSTLRVDDPE